MPAWPAPLTEAVIDSAFADHAAHLGHLNVALSLNVPLEVLIENAFGDWVENRRIALGIAAHSLIIELTESQPVAKLNRTERRRLSTAMSRLRALGYRLAIDDFGPDMPHRQMLLTLPFDLLKLDKGVVNDRAHRGVLAQAVQAAHRKGLQVVAEGVEDDAGWDRMAALGVEYVQGFLVCKPLACRQVEAWMNDWRRVPA